MASRSVSFDVLAIDKASKALSSVAREVSDLDDRIDRAGGSIEVDADVARAQEKLRAVDSQLARLNAKSLKVDADINQAQRSLQILQAELQRTTDADKRVRVEADISAAQDQLRRLQAERVSVDVDTAGAQAKVRSLAREIEDIGRRKSTTIDVDAGGAFAALARVATQLRAVSTPITISIGFASVMNALAWVQRLGAGLSSLGAVGAVSGGVAIAAFKGIGDAVSAMGEKAETGGAKATTSASAIRSATRQVEAAQRDLRDANADVVRSEQTLADAQEDARRAVESLDDARRAAIRTLQDYELRTKGMALSQESADLAIAEARQRLLDVQNDEKASSLDRARAELNVREAIQRRNELEVEGTRLAEDKAEADAKGVEQSDQVVSAQDRIKDANKRVADAQVALTRSHEEVSLAVQRLSDSQLALREAMKPQGGGGGTTVDKLKEQMKELTPEGQRFVRFLRGLLDGELKELRDTSQSKFLPGLQDGISSFMSNLGTAKSSIGGVAQSFGDFFRDIGPSAGRAAEAFARLANLGAETTFEGLAGAVNRTLDSFTEWANSQSAADIQADIREVGRTIVQLKDDTVRVVGLIRTAWDILKAPGEIVQSIVQSFREPQEAMVNLYNTIRDVAQHIPGLRDQFPELASATQTATQPTRDLGSASADLATAQQSIADAAERAIGAFTSTEQASIQYEGALDRASEAVRRNGATLDVGTQKGRDNRQALLDAAGAANRYIESMQAQGAPADQVRTKYEQQREALIRVATQFTGSRAKAQEYIDKLLEVPPAKETKVDAQTETARENLRLTRQAVTALPDKTVNIKGNNSNARSAIQSVATWLSNLKDKTVNIIANRLGFSAGGWVPGGPSTVDSVNAKLAPGEFVVRSAAAAKWGPLLEQINAGGTRGFGDGGRLAFEAPPLAMAGVGGMPPIVVNVYASNNVVASNDEFARKVSTATREGIERGYLPRTVLTGA